MDYKLIYHGIYYEMGDITWRSFLWEFTIMQALVSVQWCLDIDFYMYNYMKSGQTQYNGQHIDSILGKHNSLSPGDAYKHQLITRRWQI